MNEQETLVVISKMKKYIKEAAGMNTSASASAALSEMIRKACDKAIESAKSDKRKTVMDRDFQD
jgi:histone H3/H4